MCHNCVINALKASKGENLQKTDMTEAGNGYYSVGHILVNMIRIKRSRELIGPMEKSRTYAEILNMAAQTQQRKR